ncbi:4-amino-4-deoxychorismate lyase [Rhodococcoides trifolii]|uniref:4-amino-4-deoxychorismate lyase n=1 Tax=Rhodococcoides trifolii TaxID=908250 RepID=A0A917LH95_9NOCA|nr:aminodeoxychorismate lyase [Rhodococcus trifolii]GGG23055.1 4-amino-4-deoxychorismate lyase [Rhodococcus trifolii]
MSSRVLVGLDGAVLDPDAPLLFADDLAAVRGDGIFETLLVRGRRVCTLDLHLARLTTSAEAMDLPAPDLPRWRTAVAAAVKAWDSDDEGVMRMSIGRGRESGGPPTGYVTVGPLADRVRSARRDGVSVVTLPRGLSIEAASSPWQLLGAKTLSYAINMAALRYAAGLGADDVVFVSSEGMVLEGPRSTVVAVTGQSLLTPPVEYGVLRGTTVSALFEVASGSGYECAYAPLRPADLIVADSVWLVSSVTLAARVRSLDGLARAERPGDDEIRTLVDLAVESI